MSDQPQDSRPVLLFVAPYFPPACYGGVVQVYLGLLKRLAGYRIILVADRFGTSIEEQRVWDASALREYGFEVERMSAFELHLPIAKIPHFRPLSQVWHLFEFLTRSKREWKDLLKRSKPNIVVCGGTYSAGWLMREVPATVPLINYLHGEELTMQVRPRFLLPFMRCLQMWSIRRADINIAVSSYTARLTETMSSSDPAHTRVLQNFVDTVRFRTPVSREVLRARRGWTASLVILSLARLEPRKGLDQALRALAQLSHSKQLDDDWLYVVGGRGGELDPLQSLSRTLGIADHVRFLGFIPDEEVADLYGSADIFLQPNRDIDGDTEGFGIVFLEASACGVPVIGGVAGGTADAIQEGLSGYRVDAESVESIANAIDRLVHDPALRTSLGEGGAAWVKANCTVERAAEQFTHILNSVLLEGSQACLPASPPSRSSRSKTTRRRLRRRARVEGP